MAVTAVDDPPAYHAAATADLTGPTPTPPAVLARVVSIFAWTKHQAAASGEASVVHIAIQVAGQWTGGEVVVSTAGGPQRVPQGRIGPTERALSWSAARDATLTITVIPDGAPGGEHTITYAVDGPPSLPNPVRWRGDWVSGTSYVAQDLVLYSGRAYVCVTDHIASSTRAPTGAATSNAWWDLFANSGARGPAGPRGPRGLRGLTGEDGQGFEDVYARTLETVTSLTDAQQPDNAWTYDKVELATASGISRGGIKWYDGAPQNTVTGRSVIWWARRQVAGDEAVRGQAVAAGWHAARRLVEDGNVDPQGYDSHCVRLGRLLICWGSDGTTSTLGNNSRTLSFVMPAGVTSYARTPAITVTVGGNKGDGYRRVPFVYNSSTRGFTVGNVDGLVHWMAIGYVS